MENQNKNKRISKERLEEYAKTKQYQFLQLCEQYRIHDKDYYEEVAKPLLEKYENYENIQNIESSHKSKYLRYFLSVIIIILIGVSYYLWIKAYEFNQERKALRDSLVDLDREYTFLENKYKREVKEKEIENDKFDLLKDEQDRIKRILKNESTNISIEEFSKTFIEIAPKSKEYFVKHCLKTITVGIGDNTYFVQPSYEYKRFREKMLSIISDKITYINPSGEEKLIIKNISGTKEIECIIGRDESTKFIWKLVMLWYKF